MRWSEREIEILQKLYSKPDVTKEELLKVFPNRSWQAIMDKASDLSLKRSGGSVDEEYLEQVLKVVEF